MKLLGVYVFWPNNPKILSRVDIYLSKNIVISSDALRHLILVQKNEY